MVWVIMFFALGVFLEGVVTGHWDLTWAVDRVENWLAAIISKEEFGEWLRVAPPEQASVWIAREFVREVTPLGGGIATVVELPDLPSIPKPVDEAPEPVPEDPVVSSPLLRPVPPDMDLIPLSGQGKAVTVTGRLKRSGFTFRPPSKYRLEEQIKFGANKTTCHVRGNEEQLLRLVGRGPTTTPANRSLLLVGRG